MAIWLEARRCAVADPGKVEYEFGFLDRALGRFTVDVASRSVTLTRSYDESRAEGAFRRVLLAMKPYLEKGELPEVFSYRA